VKLIAVVPNDAKALEPVFDRAKEAGIPVITHESPGQKGAIWDIEMIDNKEYGELHVKSLAKAMGEEGEYIVYVGSLLCHSTICGLMRRSPTKRSIIPR
jgi:simple sugar transport system substrate-binding protein